MRYWVRFFMDALKHDLEFTLAKNDESPSLAEKAALVLEALTAAQPTLQFRSQMM